MPNPVHPDLLQQLRITAGDGPVLITTHDSPDPDALASGLALATLLKEIQGIDSDLIYTGLVGRAENRAVLRFLTPEWQYADQLLDFHQYTAVALVDSQPGAGNNSLPSSFIPHIVIDHHIPFRPETAFVPYKDVRADVGSTASMLYQYLAAADIVPSARLATAMFYGLRSDTSGLARNATVTDSVIYSLLVSLMDHSLLNQVLLNGLAREYFHAFQSGLQNAKITGHTITAYLGNIHRPDLVAEMSDLLVRLEHVHTALCLGCFENVIYLSLRTGAPLRNAGIILQDVVTGYGTACGHGTIAGGQVPVNGKDPEDLAASLAQKFLRTTKETGPATPLIEA